MYMFGEKVAQEVAEINSAKMVIAFLNNQSVAVLRRAEKLIQAQNNENDLLRRRQLDLMRAVNHPRVYDGHSALVGASLGSFGRGIGY